MRKLCLLVALLGFGCNNKKPEEKKDDTPVQVEAKPAAPPANPAPVKPDPGAPAAPADLPPECAQLKDMIAKMNACEKFDASAKGQLTKQADTLMTSGGADKAALATQCKGTADAIQKAGAAACSW